MAEAWRRLDEPPQGCGGPVRTQWPHRVTVGVAGYAVVIATDAAELVDRLAPWRIPDEFGDGPVDYFLGFNPPAARTSRGPRPLPGLWHGCALLLRSSDNSLLMGTLMRILSSYGAPSGDGQFRVCLMAVTASGGAVLISPVAMASLPDRRLRAAGIRAFRTLSTRVDARTGHAFVEPELGSGDYPLEFELRGWWLPCWDPDRSMTLGHAVAETMQLIVDVTPENAASRLRDVAALVERMHPAIEPANPSRLLDTLLATLNGEVAAAPGH